MKKRWSGLVLSGALLAVSSTLAWADGAVTYEDTCSGCHGEDGKGTEGMTGVPDFTNAPEIWAKSDDALTQSVITGIEKPDAEITMPPRAGDDELSDVQIKEAVVYIRKKFAK